MKIGRILIVLILIVLAALVGFRANQNIQAKKKAMSQPVAETIIPVETVQPSRTEIAEKVHAVGGIQSDAEVSVFSKVSGKIANNLVKMGSVIQPGQIVSVVNRDEVGYDYKPFEVKSDAKGVVARILLNPGASVNPNSPIMNLVDIDIVKAVAAVDEKKIRFIAIGQDARVTLEAYPGEIFSARVTNISPVGNPLSRAVDVELSIPNPSHRIKPGMYAEVEWTLGRRVAIVVPLSAVVDRTGSIPCGMRLLTIYFIPRFRQSSSFSGLFPSSLTNSMSGCSASSSSVKSSIPHPLFTTHFLTHTRDSRRYFRSRSV